MLNKKYLNIALEFSKMFFKNLMCVSFIAFIFLGSLFGVVLGASIGLHYLLGVHPAFGTIVGLIIYLTFLFTILQYKKEYITKLEKDKKEAEDDLLKAEFLLSLFAKRHYQDGLTKMQIIKMCNDYFFNKNKRYE